MSKATKKTTKKPRARRTTTKTTSEVKAKCVRCGSTKLKVIKLLPHQTHSGTTPDGERYTRIERRRVCCGDCGQHQIKKTYAFDPAHWTG